MKYGHSHSESQTNAMKLSLVLLVAEAYFKGYPWIPQIITRVRHALPLYALWVTTPETAIKSFQEWLLAGRVPYKHPTTILDTPCCTSLTSRHDDGFFRAYFYWL